MLDLKERERKLFRLGQDVLALVEGASLHQKEHPAERLLTEIVSILDDTTLEDADCFYRIDAVVRAFQKAGYQTRRHWELD